VIRFGNVWKRYGRSVALRGVSFTAVAGGLTVLRGANGSGKSTVLRLAAGIALPDRGHVTSEAERRTYLGHVSQMMHHLSVRDNLRQQTALVGGDWANVASVAGRLGVDAFWDKPVAALSRGMLQRALLVRALAPPADIILLDEPDTGLDDQGLLELEALLGARLQAGTCVIAALHSRALSSLTAHAVLSLRQGRLASDSQNDVA